MWPFKSNIPEIESVYEDEDGNIEINHSQGRFTIKRSDIIDVSFKKNFLLAFKRNLVNTLSSSSKDIKDITNNLSYFWLLGTPMTFGIWNILIYNIVRCNEILFRTHYKREEMFLTNTSIWWLDIIVNILYFLIIGITCGFLTRILIETIKSDKNIIKISTTGNSFEFSSSDYCDISSISILHIGNVKTNINQFYKAAAVIILLMPFILFLIYWDQPYWFYQNRIFESRSFVPTKLTVYKEYFSGNPKGYFELFCHGLASAGGTILFFIGLILYVIFLVFKFILIWIFMPICFAALPILQILLGVFLFNFFGILLTPRLWRKELTRMHIQMMNEPGKSTLSRWAETFLMILLSYLMFLFLNIGGLLYMGYDRFSINKKSALLNIFLATGLLIFSFFLYQYSHQLSSNITENLFDFNSYKNLKASYYLDTKYLNGSGNFGWSFIQFDKAFYWGLTSFFMVVVFSWLTPKRIFYWNKNQALVGNQLWEMYNLRLDKFRNGDPIPEANTAEEWKEALDNKQPSLCYYNNDPENKTGLAYGMIYNCYAITDPRGLAPEGWHLPSDSEWNELIDFYGGEKEAGNLMKARTYLECDLGGSRNMDGSFNAVGETGSWWSSTEDDAGNAMYITLMKDSSQVQKAFGDKGNGFYVRLVKD
jgi:uncharacterized protein (TIGR02145 family)